MEIWPQNPKLAVEVDRLVDAGGSVIQLRNDFDRLFAEKNYREVFRRQLRTRRRQSRMAMPTATAKFRQSPGKHHRDRNRRREELRKMSNIGQDYAAWEELSAVHERFPDDPDLNQVMTKSGAKSCRLHHRS